MRARRDEVAWRDARAEARRAGLIAGHGPAPDPATPASHRADAFGLTWVSDIALPGFDPAPDADSGDAVVEIVRVAGPPDRASGRPHGRGAIHPDGVRFGWGDEVAFDMIDGRRICYAPGPGWTGAMPASFYGTLAALTAAWRGMVPLHACTVELDGRAIVIAGPANAGKSTLTAGLVAAGARFVADDLTVTARGADGRTRVTRGRPTMRLHPDTATRLDTIAAVPIPDDPRGKWLARPRHRGDGDALPLGAILLLEADAAITPAPPRALFEHVFRKRWIDALPMRHALLRDVLAIAARTPMLSFPAQTRVDTDAQRARAERAIAAVRGLIDRR